MEDRLTEPDWTILEAYGLPLNMREPAGAGFSHTDVVKNIIIASRYLYGRRGIYTDARYYDSFKALLLALKIHYPAEYMSIKDISGMDLDEMFMLDHVLGRHIKLRNIALGLMSRYYRDMKYKMETGVNL